MDKWIHNDSWVSSVFHIEARALYEGLKLAWDLGFLNIEVESDNTLLIDIVRSRGAVDSSFTELRWLNDLHVFRMPPVSVRPLLTLYMNGYLHEVSKEQTGVL
ncbi:hypothetical protein PVK06_007088 [Gossypium arboreum]|uniref:RNase H type-1 domain-containing protein n=1 Tax=Gossypium arboreum TaxID=29729 RepID=A0ABR0QGD2_GOSAR|nr:hypothetical protein PVK06_007088 [Gossypium arboreum]